MNYKERYPELASFLGVSDTYMSNFEVIAECFDVYQPSLFSLEQLNLIARHVLANPTSQKPRILEAFALCADELQAIEYPGPPMALRIREHVMDSLTLCIKNATRGALPKRRMGTESGFRMLFDECLLYPSMGAGSTTQLGFFEHFIAGSLTRCRPVNWLDMLRLARESRKPGSANPIEVLSILDLPQRLPQASSRAFIVNFSTDPKGPPKWGAVYAAPPAPGAYIPPAKFIGFCEVPLTSAEIAQANIAFRRLRHYPDGTWFEAPGIVEPLSAEMLGSFSISSSGDIDSAADPKAPSSLMVSSLGGEACDSTGYTALAWLNRHYLKDERHISCEEADLVTLTRGFATWQAERVPLLIEHDAAYMLADLPCMQARVAGGPSFALVDGFIQLNLRTLIDKATKLTTLDLNCEQANILAALDLFIKHASDSDIVKFKEASDATCPNAMHRLSNLWQSKMSTTVSGMVKHSKLDCSEKLESEGESLDAARFNVKLVWGGLGVQLECGHLIADQGVTASDLYAWTMMLVFLRTHARSQVLTLNAFPGLRLTPWLEKMLITALGDNPYLIDLDIQGNPGLASLKTSLASMMARNRLMDSAGIKPEFGKDHTFLGAKAWIYQTCVLPNIDKTNYQCAFKEDVKQIAIPYFQHALALLSYRQGAEAVLVEVTRNSSAPFYLGLKPESQAALLTQLNQHLVAGNYFPFTPLILGSYLPTPEHDALCSELLSTINKNKEIKTVAFADFNLPKESGEEMERALHWLKGLLERAQREKWTAPVSIPAIEEASGVQYHSLKAVHGMLNNVIQTQQCSQYSAAKLLPLQRLLGEIPVDDHALGLTIPEASATADLTSIAESKIYPLVRDGGLRLQRQQQMQLQQQRTIQQQQHRLYAHAESDLTVGLITYNDIDHQLMDSCRTLAEQEGLVPDKKAMTLSLPGATDLQNLFHTWTHAKPLHRAEQLIGAMTKEAALMLLRHQHLFTSGLNPSNLPRGFYTQRNRAGTLVLCYSIDKGYVKKPNPLTPVIEASAAETKLFSGDYRQLDLDFYLHHPDAPIDDKSLGLMCIFATLLPLVDVDKAFAALCASNPAQMSLLTTHETRIKAHWPLFIQLWQSFGEAGFEQFNHLSEDRLSMPAKEVMRFLLATEASGETGAGAIANKESLFAWHEELDFLRDNKAFIRGLGQLYPEHQREGIILFMKLLRTVEERFGRDFLVEFCKTVLFKDEHHCHDFRSLITPQALKAFDEMIKTLSPVGKTSHRYSWLTLLKKQLQSTDKMSFHRAWDGFHYFMDALVGLDVHPDPALFDYLLADSKMMNMNVYLERVLNCLKALPTPEARKAFLRDLPKTDMTESGVPHALLHEGFNYVADSLVLRDFEYSITNKGYAFPLAHMYEVNPDYQPIFFERIIALETGCNEEDTKWLRDHLLTYDRPKREDLLLWVIHSCHNLDEAKRCIEQLNTLSVDTLRHISYHLFTGIYIHKQICPALNVEAIVQFFKEHPVEGAAKLSHAIYIDNPLALATAGSSSLDLRFSFDTFSSGDVLRGNPSLLIFEVLDYLSQHKKAVQKQLLTPLLYRIKKEAGPNAGLGRLRETCEEDAIRLTAKYALHRPGDDAPLYSKMREAYIENLGGLRQHVEHLLTLDVAAARAAGIKLGSSSLSKKIIDTIYSFGTHSYRWGALKPERDRAAIDYFKSVLPKLRSLGLEFTASTAGDYRLIKADDLPILDGFGRYKEALTQVLIGHVIVSSDTEAKGQLTAVTTWMNALQASNTYVDEFAVLLGVMQSEKPGHYWSAAFLNSLFTALHPEPGAVSFPLSTIQALLEESARPLDLVLKSLKSTVQDALSKIANHPSLDSHTKKLMACLVLRNDCLDGTITRSLQILDLIENYPQSRNLVKKILTAFLHCDKPEEMSTMHGAINWLMDKGIKPEVIEQSAWESTLTYWVNKIQTKSGLELFSQVKSSTNPELSLHILASTLTDAEQLSSKSIKLCARLSVLTAAELKALAICYPGKPSPTTEDILGCIKEKAKGVPFATALQRVLNKPFTTPRSDHGMLVATREDDFRRMLTDTKISEGERQRHLNTEELTEITAAMLHLKGLEQGSIYLPGMNKPIGQMAREELIASFKHLSANEAAGLGRSTSKIELWALLFEVLGRTTGKYPHMAQQFSLIVNDLCTHGASSKVLQLATGEGKSHFVALRAARLAGLGLSVDICTAKRTLAERDLEDYSDFYAYLALGSSLIHPHSSSRDYTDATIHYMTLADFSLFADEQMDKGSPLVFDKAKRVALLDEFDFIKYEEGTKTQYNYAKFNGTLPKAMQWFYEATNQYYIAHLSEIETAHGFAKTQLIGLQETLKAAAGTDEERKILLKTLSSNPIQLVQWLQAAHQAYSLKRNVDYCIVEKEVDIDGEPHRLREVIPLSSDGQRMDGSSFSDGVHQLLAARLNSEAASKGEPANLHLHPESTIVSSQVASVCIEKYWGQWEGFSGTVSSMQTSMLDAESKTVVLHVPTNQRDLRSWHEPCVYSSQEACDEALRETLRACLYKKHSILLACKNDQEVLDIMKMFTRMRDEGTLTPEEFAALLPYTNESELTPDEILDKKRSMEGGIGSDKNQGICLIASCFGRGDNAGIEDVFLVSAGDENDLLQKGGRTARNGASGEVHQFYLEQALRDEERGIIETLKAQSVDVASLYHAFFNVVLPAVIPAEGISSPVSCHERLLRLREYVYWCTDDANQGYRFARAQFTAWGMQLLAKLHTLDPVNRAKIQALYRAKLRDTDDSWTEIAALPSTAREKITRFESQLKEAVEVLSRLYNEFTHEAAPIYVESPYKPPVLKYSSARAPVTTIEANTISLCSQLLSLEGLPADGLREGALGKLRAVINDSTGVSSLLEQWKPHTSWDSFADSLTADPATTLDVSSASGSLFKEVLAEFSTLVTLPIQEKLSRFYERLLKPLTVTDSQRRELLRLLFKAVAPNPTERLRFLSLSESWIASEPAVAKLSFLTSFLQVMSSCTSKKDNATLKYLIGVSHQWWEKGSTRVQAIPYKESIQNLWEALAKAPLDPLISWSLGLKGKRWFEVTAIFLYLPATLRTEHSAALQKLWEAISTDFAKEKQSEQVARLARLISTINELASWDILVTDTQMENRELLEQFSSLAALARVIEDGSLRHDVAKQLVELAAAKAMLPPEQKAGLDMLWVELFKTMDSNKSLFLLQAKKTNFLLTHLNSEQLDSLFAHSCWNRVQSVIIDPLKNQEYMAAYIDGLLAALVIRDRPVLVSTEEAVIAPVPAPIIHPLNQPLLTEKVCIYQYPDVSPMPLCAGEQITIGDLHSNPIKLLYSLVRHGVVTLAEDDFSALVDLYTDAAEQCALDSETLTKYRSLLAQMKLVDGALGRVTLIGDELCDRGVNDLLVLELLGAMQRMGVNYEIIFSNHGAEFIRGYETGRFGHTLLGEGQGKSMLSLNTCISSGVVTRSYVDDLIERAYKPKLNLLSYTVSEDGKEMNLYSHAIIGWQTLPALCARLGVAYKDATLIDLTATIDKLNEVFSAHCVANEINTLLNNESIVKINSNRHTSATEDSLEIAIWNKKRELVDRTATKNDYKVNFVFGHAPHDSYLNVFGLDSNLGKHHNAPIGDYNLLVSHGIQAPVPHYELRRAAGAGERITQTAHALPDSELDPSTGEEEAAVPGNS